MFGRGASATCNFAMPNTNTRPNFIYLYPYLYLPRYHICFRHF
jgi:hypothetical protein